MKIVFEIAGVGAQGFGEKFFAPDDRLRRRCQRSGGVNGGQPAVIRRPVTSLDLLFGETVKRIAPDAKRCPRLSPGEHHHAPRAVRLNDGGERGRSEEVLIGSRRARI